MKRIGRFGHSCALDIGMAATSAKPAARMAS
jgi:hypothetical protein